MQNIIFQVIKFPFSKIFMQISHETSKIWNMQSIAWKEQYDYILMLEEKIFYQFAIKFVRA